MDIKILVLLALPFFMAQEHNNKIDTKDTKGVSKNDRMGKCEYLACDKSNLLLAMVTNNVSCCSFFQHLPAGQVSERAMRYNRDGCGGHLLYPLRVHRQGGHGQWYLCLLLRGLLHL